MTKILKLEFFSPYHCLGFLHQNHPIIKVLPQDFCVSINLFIPHNDTQKDHFCNGLITKANRYEEKEVASQQDM